MEVSARRCPPRKMRAVGGAPLCETSQRTPPRRVLCHTSRHRQVRRREHHQPDGPDLGPTGIVHSQTSRRAVG
jgi:hypothetical protein